jgi:hypothetical protein
MYSPYSKIAINLNLPIEYFLFKLVKSLILKNFLSYWLLFVSKPMKQEASLHNDGFGDFVSLKE